MQFRTIKASNPYRYILCHGIRGLTGGWANHTAPAGEWDGHLQVGDADIPVAKWSLLQYTLRDIQAGRRAVKLYIPHDYTIEKGHQVLINWNNMVCGRPYDISAIKHMLFLTLKGGAKKLKLDKFDKINHWEWAFFCTEGMATAQDPVYGRQVFGKSPSTSTPRTVENRVQEGEMIELEFKP